MKGADDPHDGVWDKTQSLHVAGRVVLIFESNPIHRHYHLLWLPASSHLRSSPHLPHAP